MAYRTLPTPFFPFQSNVDYRSQRSLLGLTHIRVDASIFEVEFGGVKFAVVGCYFPCSFFIPQFMPFTYVSRLIGGEWIEGEIRMVRDLPPESLDMGNVIKKVSSKLLGWGRKG